MKNRQSSDPITPLRPNGLHNRFNHTARAKDPKTTVKKLIRFYSIERKNLIIIFTLLLGSTLALLIVPTLIGLAINSISKNPNNISYVTLIAMIILSAYLIDWLCQTGQGWLMANSSQRIVRALRHDLFEKIQKLPLTYHDAHNHGELMSRLTNDIDNISTTIAASTSELMNSILTVLGAIIFMLLLSQTLTAIALVTMPLVILLTKIISKQAKIMFRGQQKELGHLNGIIEETISGLRMVKAFNQEENIIQKFQQTNQALLIHATKAQMTVGFLMPIMNVISNLGFTLVSFAGGIMVIHGTLAVGTIASFITYNRFFVRPLMTIAATFNMLQSALAGAERVFDVLNETEEMADIEHAHRLTEPKGNITFDNVSFEYTKGKPILQNISFTASKGEMIALVGPTGAGKTTIVNLLTRFYDATSGTIYVDGKDIKSYKRKDLKLMFTAVLQDTCLFSGSIADNIRYGKPLADDNAVIAAAQCANSDQFIKRLKDGYQTQVSGTVESLSGGQRQLIAISRAVLHPAPVLILDEATSSIDTATELKIQDALQKFKAGRTSFVIAHRLSTIKNADKILVIDKGEVIESGTHESLLRLNKVYAQMFYSQFST